MRQSWKDKINNAPSLDNLINIVEDKLHRHGEYKRSHRESWMDTATRLIDVNEELSEFMAHADTKRTELEKLTKK